MSKGGSFYTVVLLLALPSIVLGLLATTPVASFFGFSFIRVLYSSPFALSPAVPFVPPQCIYGTSTPWDPRTGVPSWPCPPSPPSFLGVDAVTIIGLIEAIISAGLLAVAIWELRR